MIQFFLVSIFAFSSICFDAFGQSKPSYQISKAVKSFRGDIINLNVRSKQVPDYWKIGPRKICEKKSTCNIKTLEYGIGTYLVKVFFKSENQFTTLKTRFTIEPAPIVYEPKELKPDLNTVDSSNIQTFKLAQDDYVASTNFSFKVASEKGIKVFPKGPNPIDWKRTQIVTSKKSQLVLGNPNNFQIFGFKNVDFFLFESAEKTKIFVPEAGRFRFVRSKKSKTDIFISLDPNFSIKLLKGSDIWLKVKKSKKQFQLEMMVWRGKVHLNHQGYEKTLVASQYLSSTSSPTKPPESKEEYLARPLRQFQILEQSIPKATKHMTEDFLVSGSDLVLKAGKVQNKPWEYPVNRMTADVKKMSIQKLLQQNDMIGLLHKVKKSDEMKRKMYSMIAFSRMRLPQLCIDVLDLKEDQEVPEYFFKQSDGIIALFELALSYLYIGKAKQAQLILEDLRQHPSFDEFNGDIDLVLAYVAWENDSMYRAAEALEWHRWKNTSEFLESQKLELKEAIYKDTFLFYRYYFSLGTIDNIFKRNLDSVYAPINLETSGLEEGESKVFFLYPTSIPEAFSRFVRSGADFDGYFVALPEFAWRYRIALKAALYDATVNLSRSVFHFTNTMDINATALGNTWFYPRVLLTSGVEYEGVSNSRLAGPMVEVSFILENVPLEPQFNFQRAISLDTGLDAIDFYDNYGDFSYLPTDQAKAYDDSSARNTTNLRLHQDFDTFGVSFERRTLEVYRRAVNQYYDALEMSGITLKINFGVGKQVDVDLSYESKGYNLLKGNSSTEYEDTVIRATSKFFLNPTDFLVFDFFNESRSSSNTSFNFSSKQIELGYQILF